MFNVGDNIVVQDTYPDEELRGLSGVVTHVNYNNPYPIEVDIEVTKHTINSIFRRVLFIENEVSHV